MMREWHTMPSGSSSYAGKYLNTQDIEKASEALSLDSNAYKDMGSSICGPAPDWKALGLPYPAFGNAPCVSPGCGVTTCKGFYHVKPSTRIRWFADAMRGLGNTNDQHTLKWLRDRAVAYEEMRKKEGHIAAPISAATMLADVIDELCHGKKPLEPSNDWFKVRAAPSQVFKPTPLTFEQEEEMAQTSDMKKCRTQKAKGVIYARDTDNEITSYAYGTRRPRCVAVMPTLGTVEYWRTRQLSWLKFPLFARPCPKRPRHGFLDSRIVNSWDEVEALLAETLSIDPDGELMLMPPLQGRTSAVATEAGISWGWGNDGATDGKNALSIPTPCNLEKWKQKVRPKGCGIRNALYLELVTAPANYDTGDAEHSTIVQYRDGPVPGTAKNYIPAWATTVPVRSILKQGSSVKSKELLEWERKVKAAVKENGGPKGLVLYLPGHTLASHWAVHGIAAGIPVVTEEVTLEVGKPLDGALGSAPKFKRIDYQRLASYLEFFLVTPFATKYGKDRESGSQSAKMYRAIATLHAMGIWSPERHLIKLMAEAPITIAKCLATACCGEVRHWWSSGPGASDIDRPPPMTQLISDTTRWDPNNGSGAGNGMDRGWVYKELLEMSGPVGWNTLKRAVREAHADFSTSGWRSGFGGDNWAKAAMEACKLFDAIDAFRARPTAGTWRKVVRKMNTAVNMVHNGGKLFNKWLNSDSMTRLNDYPVFGFMHPRTAEFILEGVKNGKVKEKEARMVA